MQSIFENIEKLICKIRVVGENGEVIDSYRVFHGRGKTYPGLEFITVDYFHPVLVITLFHQPTDEWLNTFSSQVIKKIAATSIQAVVVQHRYAEGDPSEIIYGVIPDAVYAKRGTLLFQLSVAKQQNLGFFLDIEPARKWLEQHSAGKKVLNLFSYTCSFSVIAIAAGADKVVNVDMSSAALNVGRTNHQLNCLDKRRSQFLAENILKSWGRIKRAGPYDLVILDPPSFQKGSFDSRRDYPKLIRRLPELMPQGGLVLACLNNPDLSSDFLLKIFSENCTDAVFQLRLPQQTEFPDIDPERQLKMLVFDFVIPKVS